MALLEEVEKYNKAIETSTRETRKSITRAMWQANQQVKEYSPGIRSSVKARLVAGCLVITLPVDVRRELGIEVDDQISIETDKDNGKITLSLVGKECKEVSE